MSVHATSDRRRRRLIRWASGDRLAARASSVYPEDPRDRELLSACGRQQGVTAIVYTGTAASPPVAIARPFLLMGSADDADLTIASGNPAGLSGMVVWTRAWWYFCDFAPAPDARRRDGLPPGRWFSADGTLELGQQVIQLIDMQPAAENAVRQEAPPVARLERIGGKTGTWEVDRPVALIGRHPTCKFQIQNESMQPFHAALVRTASGYWIVDLTVTGGVQINGTAERLAPLNDHDTLDIAGYTFRWHEGARPIEPVAPAPESPDDVDALVARVDQMFQEDLQQVATNGHNPEATRRWLEDLLDGHAQLLSWVETILHDQHRDRLRQLQQHRTAVERFRSDLETGTIPDPASLALLIDNAKQLAAPANGDPRKPR